MPHPHISTGFPYGCLFTISGAINCGVPILPEKNKASYYVSTFKSESIGLKDII